MIDRLKIEENDVDGCNEAVDKPKSIETSDKSLEKAMELACKIWDSGVSDGNLADKFNQTCALQKKYGIDDDNFWPNLQSASLAIKNALSEKGLLLFPFDREELDALNEAIKKLEIDVTDEKLQQKAQKSIGLNIGSNQCEGMEYIRQIFGIPLEYYESEEFLEDLGKKLNFLKIGAESGLKYQMRGMMDLRDYFSFSNNARKLTESYILKIYKFREVKKILENNGQAGDFENVCAVIEKLGDNWGELGQGLPYFTLDEIAKIIKKGVRVEDAVDIVKQITSISGQKQIAKRNGLSLTQIIDIAGFKKKDIFVALLRSGFTMDDLRRFPFLISSLIENK